MPVVINGSSGVTTNAGGLVNPSTNIDGINYSCRAWVNFNGTGTVAIRASGNVTSITDNGTGTYTVNFTTAMPDANYSVQIPGSIVNGIARAGVDAQSALTASGVQVRTATDIGVSADRDFVSVAIFR